MDQSTRQLIAGCMAKATMKLDVAQRLFASGDYEDAVSRAYYSAFHAVQALLTTEGQKATSHRDALTLFGLLFVQTGKFPRQLGKNLSNLKDDREKGDYEVMSYLGEEDARDACAEAEEFVRETAAYLKRSGFQE